MIRIGVFISIKINKQLYIYICITVLSIKKEKNGNTVVMTSFSTERLQQKHFLTGCRATKSAFMVPF